AFHYSSYGTFCLHSKSSIISTVVLPTTEIIEPIKINPLELSSGGFFVLLYAIIIPTKIKTQFWLVVQT
ncbi:MAG: hypothetical protein E7K28_07030, partial [Streptococcus salivarius]|nr:hypothetical protein [Streptococcus salivarius]